VIPELTGLSSTYFVDLRLTSAAGAEVSRNFYWLSTSPDVVNLEKSTWYGTPVTAFANFTALNDLPQATVSSSVRIVRRGADEDALVTVKNTGKSLAFFLRLTLSKNAGGEEILPVLWTDNYISLLPGESREIRATYALKNRGTATPTVKVSGLNVR
jgi:exo-1,4-beta-D-glucosaminidase